MNIMKLNEDIEKSLKMPLCKYDCQFSLWYLHSPFNYLTKQI